MTAAEIIQLIREQALRVFTTSDFLTFSKEAPDAATHALARLASRGLLVKLKKGIWLSKIGPEIHPYEAVPYLRAPWPAYVSLHSALADFGVVEEIPHAIYGVSSAVPKRYQTPVGEFRIHHLPQELIWGYETRQFGAGAYLMAEREKAFLDLAYLALTRRSPLELPVKRGRKWDLEGSKLREYSKRFDYRPLTQWLKSESLI